MTSRDTKTEQLIKKDNLDENASAEQVEADNMKFLASMMDLSKKIDDVKGSPNASDMSKKLAEQAIVELRYMKAALDVLHGDDKKSMRIKSFLGRDAGSLRAIKDTIVKYETIKETTDLFKDSVDAVEKINNANSAFKP